MMKLLQTFLVLMIITTVSVLFLLTHPSVTLPILARQRHHFQFSGTHRTVENRPLSSSVIANQHLSSENHIKNVNRFPGREVAGPNIPRWRFPLTETRPLGSVNAVQQHKETFVKAHTIPTLPHFPQFLQQHRQPALQPVYSQGDIAAPQPSKGLINKLQRNMTEESYLEKKLPFHNMPTLPHFPQFLQQHRQPGLQPVYSQRDIAAPQPSKGLINKLQRNMTEESYLEKKLPFHNWFQFPQPHAVRRRELVAQTQWVYNLRQILSTMKTKQISLVTSNAQYTDVLLNWLISATVRSGMPLETIIVISLDEMLHKLLTRKAILSVFLPPFSLLNPDAYFSAPFERVMMTRLAVMRIINHLGFDVANYDTDAIILRDPQPLYSNLSHYDVIGSVGKIPDDLVREWGITICIGVVLLRASRRTEAYWNAMNTICEESFDDQGKLNCGLKALDIKWSNNDSSYQSTTVKGIAKNGLRVSILPYNDICRQVTCHPEMRSRYYIWHKGGFRHRRDKIKYAQDGKTWFLKYGWKSIRNDYIGVKWLQSIAYYVVTHT